MDISDKYKMLIESKNDLLLSIDDKYNIIDVFSYKEFKDLFKSHIINKNISIIFGENAGKIINEIEKGKASGYRKVLSISNVNSSGLYEVEIIYDEVTILIVKTIDESRMISSHYYYQEFFDISSNGLVIVNLDIEVIKANEKFAEIIGENKDEIIGEKLLKYVHPSDHDKVYKISDLFLVTDRIEEYEIRVKTKNFGNRLFEISGFLRNELVYVVVRDVSDNKALNQMLINTKLNYQNMFNSIDDFILVAYRNGQIIYGNSAYYKKLGYTPADLRSKTLFELHPKAYREEAKNIFKDILEGNKSDCKLPLESKNGKEWPVHSKFWFGHWNNEEVIYALSKDLRKEEELLVRFNKVFQSNPNYMTIHDYKNERIIDVNRAFLQKFSLSKKDVIGKNISELGFKGSISVNSLKDHLNEHDNHVKKRYYYNHKRIDVLHSVEVIKSIEEDYVLSVMVDITELNKTKEEVEQISLIQDILMKLSTNFINIPLETLDSAINSSLALMGKFIKADRVYIFDYDFEKQQRSNTYEWCSSYASSQINSLQNLSLEHIDELVSKHIQGETVHIEDVSEIKNSILKESLKRQGIKSILTVPMILNGECVGFAGFDLVRQNRKFSKRELRLMDLFVQMLVNVFGRRQQEDLLHSQIKEREILINEIHHRVKNNLQIISSFLYLQGHYTKDKNVKQILKTTNNRIKAMAILHEKIYRGDNLEQFSFKSYLEEINKQIFNQYVNDKNIKFDLEIEDIDINLNRAIPIGLIINELVTNAIEHAFVGVEKGNLTVKVFSAEDFLKIFIEDNGVGYNIAKIKEDGSLGLVIVDSLIKQLNGSYNVKSETGTEYNISLPISNLI